MNPLVAAAAVQAAPGIIDRTVSIMKPVVITALIAGSGYIIYRKVKGSTKVAPGNNLSQLQINNNGLSYSFSEYGMMAQRLYLAMDRIGYDSASVLSVIGSMRNRDDLLMLIKTFGVRRYGFVKSFFFGKDLNLIGWLNEELNKTDKAKVGGIFRAFNIPF